MNQAAADRHYMRLALRQARKGLGRTSPNPCVGAVIVKNDTVIAAGYHRKAGTPHAEIHALRRAGSEAAGSVLYVTLEPCNHTGRTPPCSRAVAASGVSRVVVGMLDPNPLVAGTGAAYLRNRGIEVVSGLLEAECRELNRAFIKYITTATPLVVMKAGVSLDGRISYRAGQGGSITGPQSLAEAHRLRDRCDAILVGIGTVMADNPSLTTRLASGRGRDPVRLILDSSLRIDENARLLALESAAPTWIYCSPEADPDKIGRLEARGVVVQRIESVPGRGLLLPAVLKSVAAAELTSILVEGGATVHGAFLNERLVDRAHLFYAPIFAGDDGLPLASGLAVPAGREGAVRLAAVKTHRCGDDVVVSGDVVYPGR